MNYAFIILAENSLKLIPGNLKKTLFHTMVFGHRASVVNTFLILLSKNHPLNVLSLCNKHYEEKADRDFLFKNHH